MEGNVLTIYGQPCTIEFQPGAEQSWQSWANNELNQAATHPSSYANVHKAELHKMAGTIGNSIECTRQVPNEKKQQEDLKKLSAFEKLYQLI